MSTEQRTGTSKRKLLFQVFIVMTLLLLAAAAITLSLYRSFQVAEISLPEESMIYTIPAGTSLKQLAFDLHRRGIIDKPRFFILLGRELDVARRLQVGEYTLARGMTPRSLFDQLVDGRVIQYSLTIVEGQTFREILDRISRDPVLENTLEGLDDGEIMARLGHPGEHPEGRFLPDTYNFPRSASDLDFLRRAYNAMTGRLQEEWEDRQEGLPFESPEQALVLASIVEKETGRVEER
ncbi:MAG: endolytic transglycosylase MltG, partial [Gammaproteobacteria bacterium]|nr:endolytic transglycosylase MltG [Gammaproteobacteria bacterium]